MKQILNEQLPIKVSITTQSHTSNIYSINIYNQTWMFGHKQKKSQTAIFTSCLEARKNLKSHCNLETL